MISDKEPVKKQMVYNPFESQCNDVSAFEFQSEGMDAFCLFILICLSNDVTFSFIDDTAVIKVKKKWQFVGDHPFSVHGNFQKADIFYPWNAHVPVLIGSRKY